MATKALARRLDGLRSAIAPTPGGGITIVYPDEWPAGRWAAYEAARDAGDRARQADILHAQTGRRPAFAPEDAGVGRPDAPRQLVIIRSRPDGPQ